MRIHKIVLLTLPGVILLSGCMKPDDKTDPYYVDSAASSTWALQAACLATDSNPSTFWFPEPEEESCLLVHLSGLQSIEQIAFDWYPAKCCAYAVDITEDGVRWRTILTGEVKESECSGVVFSEPVQARCLRVRQRGERKGLSELELNGRGLLDRRYYEQLISSCSGFSDHRFLTAYTEGHRSIQDVGCKNEYAEKISIRE